eukprot:CAMPEP_0184674710 /NCGR_PEP_ID=MMETSP0308-20130426/87387_1 /TAXON_ID=38269 /ORGANISM="Gloeochaete witrockiana, Strain SAG 46.84" /LENGTH=187 /DNA_ID=CAMNT_0027122349 /DNA_START=1501 /DNA_END=2064 /DNA_ORIENTATION=-
MTAHISNRNTGEVHVSSHVAMKVGECGGGSDDLWTGGSGSGSGRAMRMDCAGVNLRTMYCRRGVDVGRGLERIVDGLEKVCAVDLCHCRARGRNAKKQTRRKEKEDDVDSEKEKGLARLSDVVGSLRREKSSGVDCQRGSARGADRHCMKAAACLRHGKRNSRNAGSGGRSLLARVVDSLGRRAMVC